MRLIAVTAALTVICVSQSHAGNSDGAPRNGMRHQQGRVLTDSDTNESAAKSPGTHKVGDVTLKRGIISRDSAIAQRKDLKPLLERISTRGMRAVEAKYAEELRLWAKRQNDRLLELQKIHTAHDRLKEYRDRAAAEGDDTSRIDPRLKGMEDKLRKASGEIRLAYGELKTLVERYQRQVKYMSSLMKTQEDTAMAIIRNTHS